MFVEFSESPDGSLIGGGGTTDQLGFPLSPPAPTSFWIWFYLSVFCNLLCLGLNTVFSAVSIIERHRTFRNCFYTIVLAFSLSVVVGSLCNLVYQILSLVGVQSKGFEIFSISMDLVVSFYSALLVFFLGLNRFAAFSSTVLRERLMEKKFVLYVLLGLLVFSSMTAVLVLEMSGMRRVSHQNTIYATKYILVTSHIFYTLPIISSVFYLFAYKSLRSKREDAVSDVTKSLLNRAERCNLKQGVSILITYLVCSFLYAEAYYAGRIILVMRDFLSKAEVSLIIKKMMPLPSEDGTWRLVLDLLGVVASAAPQLALPLLVLLHSKEARDVTSQICWSSVKSGITSLFASSRVSSAGSVRTLRVDLMTTTPT